MLGLAQQALSAIVSILGDLAEPPYFRSFKGGYYRKRFAEIPRLARMTVM
jgi:hypothetical protein